MGRPKNQKARQKIAKVKSRQVDFLIGLMASMAASFIVEMIKTLLD